MRKPSLKFSPLQFARGVGMIEILITVLVLSIGLLGVAALQGFSLQSNQVAYHRTIATNISYELLDHMRVNRRVVLQNNLVPGITHWQQRAAQQLPNGELTWQRVNQNTGEVRVRIIWIDDRTVETNDGPGDDDRLWQLDTQSRI